MNINLGDRAKDSITGLTGIVVAITEWLYSCRRITIQPEKLTKDGEIAEAVSFDEHQIVLVKTGVVDRSMVAPTVKPVRTGGPRPEPTRNREGRRR